ncbi:SRPBCC family protein [Cohnella fermenti]|uniref:SRPBCC domain-containing protein n=1 Tax=Cohnella fermenti TaxID=2565925 RepID=A0A4S4CE01_9BACL|nr:SRPBCC domain-containing protein [Cohnella fermenti]THF84198.1 SRPBCC domain-containing protein [Cohnella fermenti]
MSRNKNGQGNDTADSLPEIRQVERLKAPIEKVWNAVSTAEGLSAWFMPNDLQAVVGHEFHLNAGPFGQSPCKVTEVDPPHRLSFEWGKDWTLTFELKELEGGTEFTLIHAGWDPDKATEFGEAHRLVRERMAGGWVGIVAKFRSLIES